MRKLLPLEWLVLLLLTGCTSTVATTGPEPGQAEMLAEPEPQAIAEPSRPQGWAGLSGHGAPRGREDHTAIWTGSEMIVWGGEIREQGIMPLNSGARYDPATDSWTAMTEVGAPVARDDHAVVWTGSEMIVWGGNQADEEFELLASGGRYDPRNDRWTPTASGPLSPRDDPTAVWTGTEMIVWGGRSLRRRHEGSGARYNPAFDQWSLVTWRGAPDPREDHTVVWTGTEMLVWGGVVHEYGRAKVKIETEMASEAEDAPSDEPAETAVRVKPRKRKLIQLATGALYNPVTDTWRPMTLRDAPTPREDHVAVWVGGELLVWGGRNGKDSLSDGAAYDPTADRWRPLATSGQEPAARWNHTAVFADDQVIVWGGFAGGYEATGGRYLL